MVILGRVASCFFDKLNNSLKIYVTHDETTNEVEIKCNKSLHKIKKNKIIGYTLKKVSVIDAIHNCFTTSMVNIEFSDHPPIKIIPINDIDYKFEFFYNGDRVYNLEQSEDDLEDDELEDAMKEISVLNDEREDILNEIYELEFKMNLLRDRSAEIQIKIGEYKKTQDRIQKSRQVSSQKCSICGEYPRCAVKMNTLCKCPIRYCMTCIRDIIMKPNLPSREIITIKCGYCFTQRDVINTAYEVYTVDHEYNHLLTFEYGKTSCPRGCEKKISFSDIQYHLQHKCRKSKRVTCEKCKTLMSEEDKMSHSC